MAPVHPPITSFLPDDSDPCALSSARLRPPEFSVKAGQESLFATYLAFLKQRLPGYIPSRNECLYPPKGTHMGVRGRPVHTSPELEAATHPPTNRMDAFEQWDRVRQCKRTDGLLSLATVCGEPGTAEGAP